MEERKVSIIMGVYNAEEKVICRCIQSILAQSYKNWELIVCDDGSKENTHDCLISWEKTDERIKLLVNSKNMTLAPTLNRCIEVASGQYIARMDIDDVAMPDRLQVQIEYLVGHPEIDFCGSEVKLFDDNGEWGYRREVEFPQNKDFLRTVPFVHPSVMARKKFYETYLYSEERLYRRCEDYEIFMRAYAQGARGANVQKPLLAYYSDRKTGKKMTLPHRLKGVVVRAKGFAELRLFPRAFWYIWKPIISGIIPQKVIRKIKNEEIE